MPRCPKCGKTYEGGNQTFCWDDGTALINSDISEPPPTVFYNLQTPEARNFVSTPTVAVKKKKSNTLSVILIAGGVMFVLFAGIIGIIFIAAVYKNSNTEIGNKQNNSNNRIVTLVGSDKYKPELIMAINAANTAQSNALATYDTSGLERFYTGEALKAFKEQVENSKRQKFYQASRLEAQDFEYFKVNDAGSEAEVKVTETWSSIAYQYPTGKCLAVYPSTKMPQVVYLKKSPTGWMVTSNIHDLGTKIEPQPCPKTGKK